MNFKFGKSTISVTGEGCFRCGTGNSSGWYPLKEIKVKVGKKEGTITLFVCNECATKDEKKTSQIKL